MQEGEGRCPPPSPSLSATQEAFQDRTVALAYGSHTLRQLDPRLQAANCPGNQSQTLDCCRRHVVSVPPNPCQSQDTKGQWPKHNQLTSLCTKKTPWNTCRHLADCTSSKASAMPQLYLRSPLVLPCHSPQECPVLLRYARA